MSYSNIAARFEDLFTEKESFILEVKGCFELNFLSNTMDAEAYVTNPNSKIVTDPDGEFWAGPDSRNAMLTPYMFTTEEGDYSRLVIVGLVVDDTPNAKAGDVLISIENVEDYYIHQDQPWEKILEDWNEVKELILDPIHTVFDLLENGAYEDEADSCDSDVEMADRHEEAAL